MQFLKSVGIKQFFTKANELEKLQMYGTFDLTELYLYIPKLKALKLLDCSNLSFSEWPLCPELKELQVAKFPEKAPHIWKSCPNLEKV